MEEMRMFLVVLRFFSGSHTFQALKCVTSGADTTATIIGAGSVFLNGHVN